MAAYAEGLRSCERADVGLREHEKDAETAPLQHPEFYKYDLDIARGRRAVAARLRRRLVAARPDRGRAASSPRPEGVHRPRVRLGRGPMDGAGRRREGVPGARAHVGAVRAIRVPAATPTSPTSCSPPCASSSGATSRSSSSRRHALVAPVRAVDTPDGRRSQTTTRRWSDVHLRDLFAADPDRGERFTAEAEVCSSTTPRTASRDRDDAAAGRARRGGRLRAADRRDVRAASTSTRPRTAPSCTSRCACRASTTLVVDGQDVVADVHAVLDQMATFAERVRSGDWKGLTGKPHPQRRQHRHRRLATSGPRWRTRRCATSPTARLTFRFVSNVDGTDIVRGARTTSTRPRRCSSSRRRRSRRSRRSTNATTARDWLVDRLGDEDGRRASTSSRCRPTRRRCAEFGIDTDNMFGFWDWVGGRYSM